MKSSLVAYLIRKTLEVYTIESDFVPDDVFMLRVLYMSAPFIRFDACEEDILEKRRLRNENAMGTKRRPRYSETRDGALAITFIMRNWYVDN